MKLINGTMSTMNSLHEACKTNNIDQVRQLLSTLSIDEINQQDINNRTALHIAAFNGNEELLKILLEHENIDRNILNQWGSLAKDEASDELKYLFDDKLILNESFEWFDTYKHAYRISYECQNHLKQWLTKISFKKLIEEILNGYIEKIHLNINEKSLIINYMKEALETNNPIPLVRAYTEKTFFVKKLNEDLAKGGSDFRFNITYSMFNRNYKDNEPPKDSGEYIFTSILSYHTKLQTYRHFIGLTYRGVNMTKDNLDEYQKDKSILIRTFLSSSTDQTIAQSFLNSIKYRVICIYHIRNPNTTIDLHTISTYPNEKEILIIPFSVFKIINIRININDISYIELDECTLEK
ncbi:hypothetical protein I4U23_010661 [Adineta vaga]|nr:hypothetical protein I4U23_010661 [Adineta vaga]